MPKIIFPLLFVALLIGCAEKNKDIETQKNVNQSVQKENNTPFIFVGMVGEKPGLYKYNFKTKKSKVFWSSGVEEVMELSFSQDRKAAFFLTARDYGKRGVFPFISRAKLYHINLDSNKVNFVTNIGTGMQVFTEWVDSNNFKVAFNSIDIKVSDYVNQHTFIFNTFGKELLNEKKLYNLFKEGYPSLPKRTLDLTSKQLDAELKTVDNDSVNLFYFNKVSENNSILICLDYKKLEDIGWSKDNNDLIFSTVDVTPGNETLYNKDPQTSSLYIYSLRKNKIENKWDGSGYKNFFIQNDKLFFDSGFKENSFIIIYDLNSSSPVDSIKINGGCGLENIPEIPDYSA